MTHTRLHDLRAVVSMGHSFRHSPNYISTSFASADRRCGLCCTVMDGRHRGSPRMIPRYTDLKEAEVKSLLRFSVLTTVCGLLASPAWAATLVAPEILQYLKASDYAQMDAVLSPMLSGKFKVRSRRWNNAATGNSGTLTLLKSFRWSGLTCRRVRYVIKVRLKADPSHFVFSYCRDPKSGQWKFAQ